MTVSPTAKTWLTPLCPPAQDHSTLLTAGSRQYTPPFRLPWRRSSPGMAGRTSRPCARWHDRLGTMRTLMHALMHARRGRTRDSLRLNNKLLTWLPAA